MSWRWNTKLSYPRRPTLCVREGGHIASATLLRRNEISLNFNKLTKLICPTNEVREFLSSPSAKNNSLPFFRNSCFLPGVSPRQEGRTRRHEREAGCDGRGPTSVRRMTLAADGEGVWA
jgi:hypothetical protein